MAFLSAIFYFLGYHPFLAMLALLLSGLFGSAVLAQLGGHRAWFALLIPIFVFTQINFFTGHMLNGLFLNAFGTQGHAVIVHSRETDSQLNDKNIWEYDAFIAKHRSDADPDLIQDYEEQLERLGGAN